MDLNAQEKLIRDEVVYPSVDEYGFLGADLETKRLLTAAVNSILATAFERAVHDPKTRTVGQIVQLVYGPLEELALRYRDFGLGYAQTYLVIARFWGLNFGPHLYEAMRLPYRYLPPPQDECQND